MSGFFSAEGMCEWFSRPSSSPCFRRFASQMSKEREDIGPALGDGPDPYAEEEMVSIETLQTPHHVLLDNNRLSTVALRGTQALSATCRIGPHLLVACHSPQISRGTRSSR